MLSINRALIRSGFKAINNDNVFFLNELEYNINYLYKICHHGDFGVVDKLEKKFYPKSEEIDESMFIESINKLHDGAGGGPPHELPIMDPYMGGLVRWMNEAGIKTEYSCIGHHHNGVPVLSVYSGSAVDIYDFLKKYTERITLREQSVCFTGLKTRKPENNKRITDFPYSEYSFLLDIAEKIYYDICNK